MEGVQSGLMVALHLHQVTGGVFCRRCLRHGTEQRQDCPGALLVGRNKSHSSSFFKKLVC